MLLSLVTFILIPKFTRSQYIFDKLFILLVLCNNIPIRSVRSFVTSLIVLKSCIYSSKTSLRRCPIKVFSNLLDFDAINSVILYNYVCKRKVSRRDFILPVIEEISSNKSSKELSDFSMCDSDEEKAEKASNNQNRQNCQIL